MTTEIKKKFVVEANETFNSEYKYLNYYISGFGTKEEAKNKTSQLKEMGYVEVDNFESYMLFINGAYRLCLRTTDYDEAKHLASKTKDAKTELEK
jgi:hypothetical protein